LVSGSARYSSVRLSLDGVPERDRAEVYREVLGRNLMRMDVEPAPDNPLLIDLVFTALPGLRIVSGLVGPTENRRALHHIDPDASDFSLSLVDGGARRNICGGQECITESGEAVLMRPADPFHATTTTSTRILRLQVPRVALVGVAGNLDDLALRPIPRDSQPLRLLRRYMRLLEDEEELATPELRHAVVAHIHDLIVLTIGANRDGAVLAGERGMAAAKLHAIKTDLIEGLGGREVTMTQICARYAMSARQVQRLFEADGTTLSAFVLAQRVTRAYRMLTDPGLAARGVAAIAFDCGFGDLSHFNRAFRRHVQATPSDVRATARAAWETGPESSAR
jgi:AraC-like DNA-binding protein